MSETNDMNQETPAEKKPRRRTAGKTQDALPARPVATIEQSLVLAQAALVPPAKDARN